MDQLIFVTAKVNNPEMVISNQVFQDTIHHFVNKNTTVEKTASLIREDTRGQCTVNPDETSCLRIPVNYRIFLFWIQ